MSDFYGYSTQTWQLTKDHDDDDDDDDDGDEEDDDDDDDDGDGDDDHDDDDDNDEEEDGYLQFFIQVVNSNFNSGKLFMHFHET